MEYHYYIVKIAVPERSSKQKVREYIRDALDNWWGQFQPPAQPEDHEKDGYSILGDPLWNLPKVRVKLTSWRSKTR